MKPEFSIEQIRQFVDKSYTSVSARYVKAMLQHYDELEKDSSKQDVRLSLPSHDEFLKAQNERFENYKNSNSYLCGWQDCEDWLKGTTHLTIKESRCCGRCIDGLDTCVHDMEED